MTADLEQKIGYLKTIDIFQDLSKEEMLKMEKSVTMSTCRAGKVFFRPDDTAQVLFILKKATTQTLNEFKSAGLIEIGRKRMAILNLNELQEIANA